MFSVGSHESIKWVLCNRSTLSCHTMWYIHAHTPSNTCVHIVHTGSTCAVTAKRNKKETTIITAQHEIMMTKFVSVYTCHRCYCRLCLRRYRYSCLCSMCQCVSIAFCVVFYFLVFIGRFVVMYKKMIERNEGFSFNGTTILRKRMNLNCYNIKYSNHLPWMWSTRSIRTTIWVCTMSSSRIQ